MHFFRSPNGAGDLRSDLHFANRLLVDSPGGLDTANRPHRWEGSPKGFPPNCFFYDTMQLGSAGMGFFLLNRHFSPYRKEGYL